MAIHPHSPGVLIGGHVAALVQQEITMQLAIQNRLASVGACTPERMVKAGVQLNAALAFVRLKVRGPRTADEMALFNCIRALVARTP